MISPTPSSSAGTLTAMSHDSWASCRTAIITPPMLSMGAATISVADISTSCWTCWTSFVDRVMRLAGPNRVTSCSEKSTHPGEDRPAQVPAHAHRRLRPEVHGRHRAGNLQQGDQQHQAADTQDVAGVPRGHAQVDDVRVQRGEIQGRNGLRQLKNDDGDQQPLLRLQVPDEKLPKHAGAPSLRVLEVMGRPVYVQRLKTDCKLGPSPVIRKHRKMSTAN